MSSLRVTVVMTSYNQAAFLERALCSVLDQAYDNLELIIVDGGSTDGSLDILALYKDQITHLISESDRGPSEAINKGLALATGDILAVVPGDDLLLPFALHNIADTFTKHAGVNWIVGQCQLVDEDDHELGYEPTCAATSLKAFLMHDSGCLPANATFWRRDVIEHHGIIDESFHFAFMYEYACRLLARGEQPMIVSETFAARREHQGNRSAYATLQLGEEQIAAARSHAQVLPWSQRYQLWANCDERERIYALARAETQGELAKRYLMSQVMRHPWWIADETIRRALVHGIARTLPMETIRPAA